MKEVHRWRYNEMAQEALNRDASYRRHDGIPPRLRANAPRETQTPAARSHPSNGVMALTLDIKH